MSVPLSESAVERKTRELLISEVGKWLQESQASIETCLSASKMNPVDRNMKLIQAREALIHSILGMTSQLSVMTTQLTIAMERIPYRERLASEAVSTSLLITQGLRDALLDGLKRALIDDE